MHLFDDILDEVGQLRFISTLDLAKGYWQVPVAKKDQHKMAFTTPGGLYQFIVRPLDLFGAPATFKQMMDQIIKGMTSVYLNGYIVFGTTWRNTYVTHLREVLKRLGLTVNPSKCQLAMSECTYVLGPCNGEWSSETWSQQAPGCGQFPKPTTKKQVCLFLRLTGYYRCFIPHYTTIATPLSNLTKESKTDKVNWTAECGKAFNKLKEILVSFAAMRTPNFSCPFVLQTEASKVGVGAVLSQSDDVGQDNPVVYFSRKLLPREQKFEKECLAI